MELNILENDPKDIGRFSFVDSLDSIYQTHYYNKKAWGARTYKIR